MCARVVNDVMLDVKDRILCESSIDDTNIIENILFNCPIPNPFEGVDTMHRFEKYCVDHFNCLVSFLFCFFFPYAQRFGQIPFSMICNDIHGVHYRD